MSDSERLNRVIENLLADRSPKYDATSLDQHEMKMLRMAQLLRGSEPQAADPEFVHALHAKILPPAKRVSRRAAFTASVGALAAAALIALGIREKTRSDSSSERSSGGTLIPQNGQWFTVAQRAQLPSGAVHAFTAGSIHGYLMNHGGNLRAVSRICTHMQCTLRFQASTQGFVCPCHGAQFNLKGENISGPGRYSGDLPSLPTLQVRTEGDFVQVYGA